MTRGSRGVLGQDDPEAVAQAVFPEAGRALRVSAPSPRAWPTRSAGATKGQDEEENAPAFFMPGVESCGPDESQQ
ncbi:MAG: hypothetical protein M0C28_23765 [Candidatus Moduliflexus flocculans]|nr:hypothetical protein [Candidatus Moduliflexus flocculans]